MTSISSDLKNSGQPAQDAPGELAKVEAALLRHPAVSQAVVLADGPDRERSLRAYVCLDSRVVPGADRMLRLQELPDKSRPQVVELSPGFPFCVQEEAAARLMFREVFAGEAYPATMTIPEGACVLDVGAGIGLFTMAIVIRARGARIFAVEPAPEVFELLRQNVNLHGIDAVLLPYALGDSSARPARTISTILAEEQIGRVDLLRVDSEGSEIQVLGGVDDEHWPLIDRVLLSLREAGEPAALVRDLLAGRGFEVRPRHPGDSGRPGRIYLDAARPGLGDAGSRATTGLPRLPSLRAVAEEIRDQAASVLPASMVPATVVPVSRLPRAPGGERDRQPAPGQSPRESSPAAPASETGSAVCSLVARIVGVPSVGLGDDIFGLGCTSLGAVKLTTAICKQFGVRLKLRMVLDNPTAAGIAGQVDGMLRNQA